MRSPLSCVVAAATALTMTAAACGSSNETDTATDDVPTGDAAPADEIDSAFEEMEDSIGALEDSVGELDDPSSPTTEPAPTTTEMAETTTSTAAAQETNGTKDPADGSAQPAVLDLGLAPLLLAIESTVGPTDDLTVQANRLGFFPSDVPTLPQANVFDSSVQMYRFGLPGPDEKLTYTNRIVIWSPATGDSALAFYTEAFESLGYAVTDEATATSGEETATKFWYDLPDAGTVTNRRIDVLVRDDEDPGSTVELTYRAQEPYAGQVEVYTAWTAAAPLPEERVPQSMQYFISGKGDPSAPRSYSAGFGGGWDFPGIAEADYRSQLPALLDATSEYELSEFGSFDNYTVSLDSSLFESGAGLTIDSSDGAATATLLGRWTVEG